MIGETVSHYRIVDRLGEGGMGTVYRAEDLKLKRPVALKFLSQSLLGDEQAKARFIQEAEAASALDHPNVCTVYEIDETEDGRLFIAMACYEGESLKERISRGPLPVDEALDIARQIALGLAKAHERNIVHRDIKPANILLTPDGLAKIVDFGLAKLAGPAEMTRTGAVLGTLAYMSPEQTRGTTVDHRADLWAIGVLLYEMLTGRPPFEGYNEFALMYAIASEQVDRITALRPEVAPALEEIVERLLEKNPKRRFPSCSTLLDALDSQIPGASSLTGRTGLQSVSRRYRLQRWQRRRLGWAVACCALLAAISLGALYLWPGFLVRDSTIAAVAVLPFENLSGDASQDYYADGMTDALINQIGQIAALNVISRTSVMRYKQSDKALPEIARELKVDAVVEASVVRDGDQVRVSARLIRTNPERQIWADSYTRNANDIISLHSELAREIADRVEVVVTDQERERITRVQQVDTQAHDAYLKGKYSYWKGAEQDLAQSIADFREAIDIEPTYALAYAWLSLAYRRCVHFGYMSPENGDPKAAAAARRAMDLDDTLADVQVANLNYERALELNPNNLAAVTGLMADYVSAGRFDEGIAAARKAIEIDPLSVYVSMQLGWANYMALRYDEAISALLKAIAIDPTYAFAWEELAWAYAGKGLAREALAAADTALALTPPPVEDEITLGGLGRVYAQSDRRDKAREFLDTLIDLRSRTHVDAYYIAEIYAGLGVVDSVFVWLDLAQEEKSPSLRGIRVEPWLAPLKQDPRFQDLVRRANL